MLKNMLKIATFSLLAKNFRALFLGVRLLVGNAKSVFSLKNVPQKFFSFKNMLKIPAFSLLAKIFSGNISRGDLTDRKCFSVLLKKIHGYPRTFFWSYELQIC